jgi:hypothetical protein
VPAVAATAARGASTAPATDRIARVALPLACAVSWLAIAAFQREPSVAAEARFLGLVTAVVLFAALQAAPRIGTLLGVAVVLLGAIPWALPGTADRGVAAGLLLAAALAVAAATSARRPAADDGELSSLAWTPSRVVGLVLGSQLLARSGELLAPDVATVVSLVVWAAVAALAILLLAAQRGALAAALAAAAAFALGPGFTMTTSLALAAPVLATLIADARRPPVQRVACVAALLAPLAVDFEHAAFLALAAIASAGPRWIRWIAGLAALIAFFGPGADRAAGLVGPAWLLALVPIVVSEVLREAGTWRFAAATTATRFAAICLGLAVAAQLPDRSALAIPAVLLASTLRGARPLAAALQTTWSGVLVFATAVLAAYPWLRETALADAWSLLGAGAGWRSACTAVVLLAAAAAIALVLGRSRSISSTAAALAPLVLVTLLAPLALLTHPAIEASPIASQPVELDADSPSWSASLDAPAPAATVILDSSLSHAESIAPGTVIATVRLATAGGPVELPLRAGLDTGEWAARRPDVAAIAGFTAPAAWLHWVDAGRGFFGQRYRAWLPLDAPVTANAIEVRLAPGTQSDVVLTVFHLELTR